VKSVFICSPYRGNTELNTARAQRYCRYAYTQGVVPFAPHLHNTQFLEEDIPEEREAGIRMGLEFLAKCDELWVFGDRLSEGMQLEIKGGLQLNKTIRNFNERCQEVKKSDKW
jgi:hypothetical protein